MSEALAILCKYSIQINEYSVVAFHEKAFNFILKFDTFI